MMNGNAHHSQVINSHSNSNKSSSLHGEHLNYKDVIPYGKDVALTDEYIHGMVDKIIEFLQRSNNRDEKIVEFVSPEKLQQLIDFSLPENEQTLDEINSFVDLILKYVVKTGHPNYYNQLWAGIDTHCMLGEWLTAATNTAPYTYEVAPVYVIMEKYVLEKLLSYAGFHQGEAQFFPGGSICNIAAISLARYRYCPDIKAKGTYGMKPFIMFVSEEGHYSMSKGAGMLGIGTDHIVKIKTDRRGKMIPSELEKEISRVTSEFSPILMIFLPSNENLANDDFTALLRTLNIQGSSTPLLVCATSGTTVVGAYDPLNAIADICKKYDLWLHIDAAWGGGCLMSTKYKYLMSGCERADSITWDPHKMTNTLQQCSILLVREKGQLQSCYGQNAKYLFQKDKKLYDTAWDIGDRTFQCGRKNDVLKLHLMWKAKGSKGIEEQVDNAFDNSRYLAEEIRKRKNFKLVREVECTNVCFQFIPKSLIDIPDSEEKQEKLARVPPEIKKRMTIKGSLMIGYQPLGDHGNVFRMITVSPVVKHSDMDFLLDEIERLGNDL